MTRNQGGVPKILRGQTIRPPHMTHRTTHYIESVIDGMDWKTMYQYVFNTMLYDLKDNTDEEIDEMYNDYFNEQ